VWLTKVQLLRRTVDGPHMPVVQLNRPDETHSQPIATHHVAMIIRDTNVVPNGPGAGNVVFPILQVVAEHAGQRLAVPTIVVE
jgi:hypothetical protein